MPTTAVAVEKPVVAWVQVPAGSTAVATVPEAPTAHQYPAPKATALMFVVEKLEVRWVQVIPSGLVASFPASPTAT